MIRSGQICPSLKKTPKLNQHIHVSLPRGFHVTASHWTSWWGRFMRWILIQLLQKWTCVSPKPVQWPFYFGDKGLSRLKMDHPSAGSKSTESSWSFKHMRRTRNILHEIFPNPNTNCIHGRICSPNVSWQMCHISCVSKFIAAHLDPNVCGMNWRKAAI